MHLQKHATETLWRSSSSYWSGDMSALVKGVRHSRQLGSVVNNWLAHARQREWPHLSFYGLLNISIQRGQLYSSDAYEGLIKSSVGSIFYIIIIN